MICSIYNKSLKFSRTFYGVLALIGFFIENYWLIFFVSVLMGIGAFSIKLNLPYQFHFFFLRKLLEKETEPVKKDTKEIGFACSLGGFFLFVCFLLLYFENFVNFAWGLTLIVSFLMFLAGIANVCLATIIYVLFKKTLSILKIKNENENGKKN